MELNRWSFLLCLVVFGLIMKSLPTPRLQKQFSLFLLSFRVFPFMLKSLNCLSLSFLASVVKNETSSLLSAQIAIFPLSCMKGAHPPLTDGNPLLPQTSLFAQSHLNSVQFSSVAQSYLTLCNPMNCSTPGLPVHRQLLEFTQTQLH